MARDDEIEELLAQIDHLMREVERYRTASEDALQQLDWCIGYFTASHKRGIAKSLSTNRSFIRRHLLRRAEQPVPTGAGSESS